MLIPEISNSVYKCIYLLSSFGIWECNAVTVLQPYVTPAKWLNVHMQSVLHLSVIYFIVAYESNDWQERCIHMRWLVGVIVMPVPLPVEASVATGKSQILLATFVIVI